MQCRQPNTMIVTGAQGGIGQEILKKFIAENINIIAVDIKIDKIKPQKNIIHIEKCDIGDLLQVNKLWSSLSQEGIVVDGLINNAGIFLGCHWKKYTKELIYNVINTNLIGTFLMCQAFANQTQHGIIINISSVAAFTGSDDPVYGASKAGILGLTKSMAINLAPNIRVNAIAPTVVRTEMTKQVTPETLAKYRQGELLSECVEPEAVANAIMFLASSMSNHITGCTLDINNGVYLR